MSDQAERERRNELWAKIEIAQNLLKMRELEAEKQRLEADLQRTKDKFTIPMLEGMLKEAEAKLAREKKQEPITPPPSPIKPIQPPTQEIIVEEEPPEGVYR